LVVGEEALVQGGTRMTKEEYEKDATCCDRGMPFVMAHPDSEAAKAFEKIAERTKEYIGFKETEKETEIEKFPYHFQKPQA